MRPVRIALALLVCAANAGCVYHAEVKQELRFKDGASAPDASGFQWLQVRGKATGEAPMLAARDAWDEAIRKMCGSTEHEEEMVHEYTYHSPASGFRDDLMAVREGYVRCNRHPPAMR